MSLKPWKILKSTLVFDHKWYKLRRDEVALPNGKVLDDYFVSVRQDVVVCFPITKDKEVIFVRQYKHGAGKILLELPGGMIDEGEQSKEAAIKRELLEETGYRPEKLEHIITLQDNPTKDTNRIYGFIAYDVDIVAEQNTDVTEDIEIVKVPLNEIRPMILNGDITVSNSVSLCLLALERLI